MTPTIYSNSITLNFVFSSSVTEKKSFAILSIFASFNNFLLYGRPGAEQDARGPRAAEPGYETRSATTPRARSWRRSSAASTPSSARGSRTADWSPAAAGAGVEDVPAGSPAPPPSGFVPAGDVHLVGQIAFGDLVEEFRDP